MKIKYLFILLFFICKQTFSQKEILVGGKKVKMEFLDSSSFNINGTWKIVDRKYFYDDGEISNKVWDRLDKGNVVLFNDSMFYAYTHSLTPNLIKSPLYKQVIDSSFSEGGEFFEQFNPKVLSIYVWERGDWEVYKKRSDAAVPSLNIHVINKNYIMISGGNSFKYLEREHPDSALQKWKKLGSYHLVNCREGGYPRIQIENDYKNKFIEYFFIPNTECKIGVLKFYSLNVKELQSGYHLRNNFKTDKIEGSRKKGYLLLSEIKNNVFTFAYERNNSVCDEDRGLFLWRLVSDTTKNVIIESDRVFIYSSPNIPTKMYLKKFDCVEVISEKNNWLHIKYYGKKIVEGWIRKKDTELQ
jgi:hypothetical protein